MAITRAAKSVVMSWPEEAGREATSPAPFYDEVRKALGAPEEVHEEEVFGPAEGLHSTYRMIRDEVLEASWRAGSALSEMRLDTAEDVNRAVVRYLELIKLAALLQQPGAQDARETLAGVNELVGRLASPEQRAVLEASALDDYVLGEERERDARSELDRRAARTVAGGSSSRAAGRDSPSPRPTSTSTGRAPSSTSSPASSRSRRSRRSTSGSGS